MENKEIILEQSEECVEKAIIKGDYITFVTLEKYHTGYWDESSKFTLTIEHFRRISEAIGGGE